MTPNEFLIWLTLGVGIVGWLLIRYLRSPSCNIEKFIADLKLGRQPSPSPTEQRKHKTWEIYFNMEGFSPIKKEGAPPEVPMVQWNSVKSIRAYKVDLWATDCICLFFETGEEKGIEITEEAANWSDFIEFLPRFLPGCKPQCEWWRAVTYPAFETNLTNIYERVE